MGLKDMKSFKDELNSVGIMSWQDRLFTDYREFNRLLSRIEMETSMEVQRFSARVTSAHVAVPVKFNEIITTHIFWFVSGEYREAYKRSYQTFAEDHPRFRQQAKNVTGETF